MFLSKKQLKILDLYRKNIFLKESIATITQILKSNYPKTHDAIISLKTILNIEKVGSSNICSLNLSDKTISILAYMDEQEALSREIENIDKFLLIPDLEDDIVIVTGSYATKKNTPDSDIDIAVITRSDAFNKHRLLTNMTALYTPEMHIQVFSEEDFKMMLISKDENFGKEVFRKHLILRNAENYYRIIRRITNNGINV